MRVLCAVESIKVRFSFSCHSVPYTLLPSIFLNTESWYLSHENMAENSNPWLLFITVFIVTVTLLDSRNEFFLITGNLIAFVQIVIYPNVKNLFYPYSANELELRNSGNIAKFAPVDIYSTTETPG